MANPNNFNLTSDYALVSNPPGPIELTVSVPGSVSIPAAGQVTYTDTETVEDDTAQYVMGRVFSSVDTNDVLLITGNNPDGILRFDRGTYYIAFYIVSSTTNVTGYVNLQNKRNDISATSGAAETITFQLRPLGKLF